MPYEETAKARARELCASVLEMRGSAVTSGIRSFLIDVAMGMDPPPLEPLEYSTDLSDEYYFCSNVHYVLRDSSAYTNFSLKSLFLSSDLRAMQHFYEKIVKDHNSINPQPQ